MGISKASFVQVHSIEVPVHDQSQKIFRLSPGANLFRVPDFELGNAVQRIAVCSCRYFIVMLFFGADPVLVHHLLVPLHAETGPIGRGEHPVCKRVRLNQKLADDVHMLEPMGGRRRAQQVAAGFNESVR